MNWLTSRWYRMVPVFSVMWLITLGASYVSGDGVTIDDWAFQGVYALFLIGVILFFRYLRRTEDSMRTGKVAVILAVDEVDQTEVESMGADVQWITVSQGTLDEVMKLLKAKEQGVDDPDDVGRGPC